MLNLRNTGVLVKRIILQEVAAAYKKLGIAPLCRKFSIVENRSRVVCGCPQTVLYYADTEIFPFGIPKETYSESLIVEDVSGWARWKYGREYAGWFRMFYDFPDRRDEPRTAREIVGAGDGVLVRFGLARALADLGVREPIRVPPPEA